MFHSYRIIHFFVYEWITDRSSETAKYRNKGIKTEIDSNARNGEQSTIQ
jgi:hypothetical protein